MARYKSLSQRLSELTHTVLRLTVMSLSAYVLIFANLNFFNITWGTGSQLGDFSIKWGLLFLGYTLFSLTCLVGILVALWQPERLSKVAASLSKLRNKLGGLRWLLTGLVLITPVWLLQYSWWGVVLYRPYLRLVLWGLTVLMLGLLITTGEQTVSRRSLLAGLVLSAAAFVASVPLQGVTEYPFSLGWSEGNRLWDYSILFGRERYDYPADQPIPVLLDIGRQFVGGLPFLIPRIGIGAVRLWVALTYILPFLALGWLVFYLPDKGREWLLVGLWGYTFLYQGPIHPPLVICALLIALAWRRPLWLAIPLIMVASYLAQLSRWTWLFAPGLWAGMLELAGGRNKLGHLQVRDWVRSVSVGLAGVFGGYVAPFLIAGAVNGINEFLDNRAGGVDTGINISPVITSMSESGTTTAVVVHEATSQPLLWYRLLPNATYGSGILTGLLIAAGPLIILLAYLSASRVWRLNIWQKLSIILPLLAFLMVGLTVSVKIGGGGDLHNLDMFLIGLMFTGAIAWRNGGREWLSQIQTVSSVLMVILGLVIILPAYQSLMALWPISYMGNINRVMTLRDDRSNKLAKGSLPSEEQVEAALAMLREEITRAEADGEILFMDQRQLLTFGYVQAPLVPEYDKKFLINRAMSEHAGYFQDFYYDLAIKRFSLIISDPINERIQDSSYQFGEENNAWVKWVSKPLLCYYEPIITLKDVSIQLLGPRTEGVACLSVLPVPPK